MHRTLPIIALLAATLSAGPALAADRLSTYEEEGITFCALDLDGSDGLLISGERGYGATGSVWLELSELDRAYPDARELRLVVTLADSGIEKTFIGSESELSGAPSFEVPLSLLRSLTDTSFAYRIEKRAPVTLEGITAHELKAFVGCMTGGTP